MKIKTKSETRWVISYQCGVSHGIYTGGSLTRKDAIKEHVTALGVDLGTRPSKVPETPEEFKLAWKQAKKRGDKAVKATVTWEIK